jgi:site-specific recombinase XerD
MGELKDRMKANLSIQNLHDSTQAQYLKCVYDFAAHYMRSPKELGTIEVRCYLHHLAVVREVGPSMLKVHRSALKYLYADTLGRPEVMRSIPLPKVEKKLPVVLSGSEVESILAVMKPSMHRVVLMAAYGGGLRISEACRLQAGDIDSARMVIRVRRGKGRKDYNTLLPKRLLAVLREYYRRHRPQAPYLFPGKVPGRPISRKAVTRALAKAVKASGVGKHVTPHTFRHCFATHLLDMGTDIRTIQVLLGHGSIRSTQCYAHVSTRHIARTKSPLDVLGTDEAEPLG